MSKKTLGAQMPAVIASNEQPISEPEKELVREAYERLPVFRDGCREMHERARVARRIALLDDPYQDPASTPAIQKTLQLPTLKSTINCCVADQMDNMPEAVMLPETPELQEVAEDVTDVVRFVLTQNDYERVHRSLVEDLFVTGTSIRHISWDEDMDGGRGNVCVMSWPVEAFLWDPVAENIQDARAVIKVSWHPLSWYAAHYPDAAMYVRGEAYAHEDVGVPDAWAKEQAGDEDRAMLLEYWYRRYDAKTRRYTISVAYIAGGALLDHAQDVYAHGMYPFVLDVYNTIKGLPVGEGMAQEYAPMMRYINRYYHYFDINARMASKPKLLVNRNSGIDNDALTDFNRNVVEGNSVEHDSINWLLVPTVSGAAAQVAIQLQTDLKQDSGQNQFTRGETAGGVTAASAIASLQEAGGKTTRLRTATLNQGFKDMVEQIIWLLAEFYDGTRTRMITGKDGQQRPVDMSSGHLFGGKGHNGTLPPPPYSVQIQVQRRNPMRVQAQNELFIEAYKMAAQAQQNFPLSVLFEMLTVDGKDKLMPVVRQAEQWQQQMAQMAQMLEQQKAVLEQKDIEIANMEKALTGGGARQGMYPQASATDEALPEGGEMMA